MRRLELPFAADRAVGSGPEGRIEGLALNSPPMVCSSIRIKAFRLSCIAHSPLGRYVDYLQKVLDRDPSLG